jgi:hypothetical protein
MSPKEEPHEGGSTRDGSGDEDSTHLVKRLRDNQPLSDTHEVPDERRDDPRQYGMHAVESPSAAEEKPDTRRGSDD